MGFQHLTAAQRKAVASQGGKATPTAARGFSNPETARRAARKRWMLDNDAEKADSDE